jgi:hypothetical protein
MRIGFTLLLIVSLTLPLFQVKSNSSTHSAIDYIKEKVLDGNWGMIANQVINITESAFEERRTNQEGVFSKIKNAIITGYGNGFSSIGAVLITWNNYRFDRFELVPTLPLFIIFIITIQVLFHNYFYKRRNAILSVLSMLLVLSVFGNCIGHESYSSHLTGLLLFVAVQIAYMIYFYWFPYKGGHNRV